MAVLLLLAVLLSASVLAWLAKHGPSRPNTPRILTYHKIDTRSEWGVTRNTPRQFARQVSALRDAGYRAVPLAQVVETIRRGTPVQERIFALTFDDAYEGLFYHALPVLREASWPAAVFVVTDYIGNENSWDVNIGWRRFRHLDWPMMRQMSDAGITFGSHTVSHPDLTRLSVKQIRYELERSRRDLEDGLGKRVEFLSYPFGRYNRTVQHLAQEAGYVAAFGNYPRGRNSDPDWLALPRAGVYLMDAVSEILVKADPDPHPVLFACEDLKGRGISFLAQGTPLTKALLPKKALTSALPKR